jgi:glycosyltransferase involved in cell wall biosynthesis
LTALASQTLPKDTFEVIVVDNGSTDSTLAEASRFQDQLPLRVVSKPNCNVSAVRNYGASLAHGQILAFLDADCIPPSPWLEQSLSLAPPGSIWGAHYLVPQDSTWVGKIWFAYQATAQEGPVSFMPASNLFITASDFERIGRFGESLETSEDVEISLRAKQHGMNVIAFPSLAVFHQGTPRTLRHFYRQNRWHGTHVLRIFLENLPSLKNLHIVAMSFYILLMFWCAIVTPFIAIPRHHPLLALVPPVLLLLPALLLASWKSFRAGRPGHLPPLFVLYMTYFLARAAALTHLSTRNHR